MTREESEIGLRGAGWGAFIDENGLLDRRITHGVFKKGWTSYPRDMEELAKWTPAWAKDWERPSKYKVAVLPENMHVMGTI